MTDVSVRYYDVVRAALREVLGEVRRDDDELNWVPRDTDPRTIWRAHVLASDAIGITPPDDPASLGRAMYASMRDRHGAEHPHVIRFVEWWSSWGYPVGTPGPTWQRCA